MGSLFFTKQAGSVLNRPQFTRQQQGMQDGAEITNQQKTHTQNAEKVTFFDDIYNKHGKTWEM